MTASLRLPLAGALLSLLAGSPLAYDGLLARPGRPEAAAPSWVTRFPHDPEKHVGVGHASKRDQPRDYRAAAQSQALAQISREISLVLKTENLLTQSEGPGGWQER